MVLGGKGTLKKDLSALRDSFIEAAAQSASDRLLLAERCCALPHHLTPPPRPEPGHHPSLRALLLKRRGQVQGVGAVAAGEAGGGRPAAGALQVRPRPGPTTQHPKGMASRA